jgi:hypothetical protein
MNTFDKIKLNITEVQVYITSCSCCKMNKHQNYKYVKYDDDMIVHDNIMFDMKNINFAPNDTEWTECSLYEE